MQKITPFLWFDNQAEEAINFYIAIFPNSKITNISRYGKEGFDVHHRPEGTIMTIEFELDGQKFTAINGGSIFKFNESISFVVSCESQDEVDHYWEKLSAVSESEQCGWLKDKFGLSWQIIPTALGKLLSDPDNQKAGRVMNAMLKMKKIDIKVLENA